jgi:hypothetical protein
MADVIPRGKLHMTQPVQIAFLLESGNTGKRGYVIEGLYITVRQPEATHTFGFWAYGERGGELMPAGGLRVTEDGVAYNHHFLQTAEQSNFAFVTGEYVIEVHARLVNRKTPYLLHKVKVTLPPGEAMMIRMKGAGVLFTWEPELDTYSPSMSNPERLPVLRR